MTDLADEIATARWARLAMTIFFLMRDDDLADEIATARWARLAMTILFLMRDDDF